MGADGGTSGRFLCSRTRLRDLATTIRVDRPLEAFRAFVQRTSWDHIPWSPPCLLTPSGIFARRFVKAPRRAFHFNPHAFTSDSSDFQNYFKLLRTQLLLYATLDDTLMR
jgi:hypothetical protein